SRQSRTQLEGAERAGHTGMHSIGVANSLDTAEQAANGTADVSGDAFAGILQHADQAASPVGGAVESFKTDLADKAFAEAGLELDDVTTLANRAFPDADVGILGDEQAGEVERLVVAFVEDRTLLTSAEDGGVTNLDVSVLGAQG